MPTGCGRRCWCTRDGGVLRQLSGNRELLFVQTESVMAIKVCDDAVQLSEEIDTDAPDEAPETDPALVEKLRAGLCVAVPGGSVTQHRPVIPML